MNVYECVDFQAAGVTEHERNHECVTNTCEVAVSRLLLELIVRTRA